MIRNPQAVRPWQHVLDPLCGYLTLAERMLKSDAQAAQAWNFGPADASQKPVEWILDTFRTHHGATLEWRLAQGEQPHETHALRLDSSKARSHLQWSPRLDVDAALRWTAEWYNAWACEPESLAAFTLNQIANYEALPPIE